VTSNRLPPARAENPPAPVEATPMDGPTPGHGARRDGALRATVVALTSQSGRPAQLRVHRPAAGGEESSSPYAPPANKIRSDKPRRRVLISVTAAASHAKLDS
jgi:hypothetical protein